MTADVPDFLDEILAVSEAESPGFAARVDEALARRVMARALAERPPEAEDVVRRRGSRARRTRRIPKG